MGSADSFNFSSMSGRNMRASARATASGGKGFSTSSVMVRSSMTAKQYRAALEALELSQGNAAKWLKISIRASHGYANGDPIPEPIAKLLRLCVQLNLKPEDVQ